MPEPPSIAAAMSTGQGFGADAAERLPLPARHAMNEAQRAAADAITAGPRKAVFGPFVPLLQCPTLMGRIGKTGEALRFEGSLPARIRELVICAVARETSNQFEWQTHAPIAARLGIAQGAIDALAVGRRPRGLAAEEETAIEFVTELVKRHGVSDATYAEAVRCFGAPARSNFGHTPSCHERQSDPDRKSVRTCVSAEQVPHHRSPAVEPPGPPP